jgi:hypothetical protein
MNLVEIDHALRKLRLSGMADVLDPGGHPNPATEGRLKTGRHEVGARGVDRGVGVVFLRRDEQRLERRQATAGVSAGAAGVVAPAD